MRVLRRFAFDEELIFRRLTSGVEQLRRNVKSAAQTVPGLGSHFATRREY